ncbi:DUF1015 domain-containing protein [Abyssalbus ytuae]|uniref:DUF1015 domain-containing protein n=1 Tax=Abyssalbus ytuae TaxID=2926907 RepID=A0A9E7CU51_9FLAO|nr:DUF1015 domain-containing protein [Abyssalbus ytuae]UOB17652.1 DUF1015 domain-containing protein [Abyssalbus ytuae]
MPEVIPFCAVIPNKKIIDKVVTKSYESYTKEELDKILQEKPESFLHILKSGYKKGRATYGKKRYSRVREKYLQFKENDIFQTDSKPSFYIYKIVKKNSTFWGILAATATSDYEKGTIKKHENTIQLREELFKKYLKSVQFNAEPVLLTYPNNDIIEEVVKKKMQQAPDYTFNTNQVHRHFLWKISDESSINAIQQEFANIQSFYIADGHHRCSSSYLLSQDLKMENTNHTGKENYNYFLSFLIQENNLKIYEFNRLIKDLNGLSKEVFLNRIQNFFYIENKGSEVIKPAQKHQFGMYLDNDYYLLTLKTDNYSYEDKLDELDTQILYKTILYPVLGIKNMRNNDRVQYVYGKDSYSKIKNLVDTGSFAVGFVLMPVSITEIKDIADNGLQMPPKSTYIEPKLLSALTIYEI